MDTKLPASDTLTALIERLQAAGVRLRVDGDLLRYEAPAGALTDELAVAVRARKAELLAFLQAAGRPIEPDAATIPRAAREATMPLSVAQQRLWFLYHLDNRGATYNVPKALRLRGPLDAGALEAALAASIARHESLRSSFLNVNGQPVQRIHERVPFTMGRQDLSHLDAARRLDAAANVAADVARRPFDLAQAPALRAHLVRLAADDHVLIVVLHHIVADGRSLEVLFEELAVFYGAARAGTPASLPPLPIQCADYAVFERSWLARPEMEARVDWWRGQLAGAPPLLRLPTDRPRPAMQTFDGGTERFTLPADLTARLRALARERGASLYMTVAAALVSLLSIFSGEDDICLGCPAENRQFPETSNLIGVFINTLVLRTRVDRRRGFAALVDQVRDTALDAFDRQDVPFERLVDALRPERNLSASPLFQVALSWLDGRRAFPSLPGLTTEPLDFDFGRVKFDLNLELYETDTELHVAWFYNTVLFDAATMRRWTRHLVRLLETASADPLTAIADLPLVPDDDARLLASWSATGTSAPAGSTVVELFEAQVPRTPEAPAVVHGDRFMSYEALNRRADAVANWLAAAGCRRGDVIALLMDRSVDVVAAILGVLKAGAAYLPIDTAAPAERQAFMLRDSGAVLAIAANGRHASGPAVDSLRVAAFEDVAEGRATPRPRVSSRDAAYVLYTSGSTGVPKAVVMEHGGLRHYVSWAARTYTGGDPLAFPLFTSLSFDLTVTSLFVPLVTGGRVVVYPEGEGVPAVFQVVRDKAVDVVKLTPAHLSMIADMPLAGTGIRTLILGGEDLKTDLARRAANAFEGAVEICNEYGPTETAVGCMLHRFDATDDASSVPIGRAADDVRLYILDRFQRPAPIGAVGELFVAGAGVARGYLGRPDLTAERFLPDPLQTGARMYRTGDLARYRADGVMEYLGRTDRQVKIRGHRVELDEIAAVLTRHEHVTDCVVQVVEREPADASPPEPVSCVRCGLSSTYPGTSFDAAGVCDACRAFEQYRERVQSYFRTPDDLRAVLASLGARRRGEYDCLALVSGGKDSVYMLARLKDMGARVLAYTFDPGYLSDEAKANIRRATTTLGVDHVFGETPHMREIFADSLARHANVCNGCFKTLYTLSMAVARERGIPAVVTGLSRGQLFETRLSKYYNNPRFDPGALDAAVLEARKVYHRLDDVIARRLDVSGFQDDRIFEDVQVLDFYRYVDVSLRDMLAYLDGLGWQRPSDTGRSTNCLINDVGIFVHKRRRGYHNYALPYSWDVRMGHKTRDEAVAELDDEIDERRVRRMLDEIGVTEPVDHRPRPEPALVAYYVAAAGVSSARLTDEDLRAHLERHLPPAMVPAAFVALEALPLTPHGKVDWRALPAPRTLRAAAAAPDRVPPRTPVEREIAGLWSRALGFDSIGVHDNFFALGGHSLMAAQVASGLASQFGVDVPLSVLFEKPTIAELSEVVSSRRGRRGETLDDILADVALLSDAEAKEQLGL